MFIDRAKIRVQGGNGGNGVTAFRREKFVPRGGPSGGDGGRGGDVWIQADASLNTLLHLKYNPLHVAGRGMHGEGSNRSGKEGNDAIVRVPVGTQIFDPLTNELIRDLEEDVAVAAVLATRTLRPQRIARRVITRKEAPARNLSFSLS
jgi:GTP-binding protein